MGHLPPVETSRDPVGAQDADGQRTHSWSCSGRCPASCWGSTRLWHPLGLVPITVMGWRLLPDRYRPVWPPASIAQNAPQKLHLPLCRPAVGGDSGPLGLAQPEGGGGDPFITQEAPALCHPTPLQLMPDLPPAPPPNSVHALHKHTHTHTYSFRLSAVIAARAHALRRWAVTGVMVALSVFVPVTDHSPLCPKSHPDKYSLVSLSLCLVFAWGPGAA